MTEKPLCFAEWHQFKSDQFCQISFKCALIPHTLLELDT